MDIHNHHIICSTYHHRITKEIQRIQIWKSNLPKTRKNTHQLKQNGNERKRRGD